MVGQVLQEPDRFFRTIDLLDAIHLIAVFACELHQAYGTLTAP